MRLCENCGKCTDNDNAAFCCNCGSPFDETDKVNNTDDIKAAFIEADKDIVENDSVVKDLLHREYDNSYNKDQSGEYNGNRGAERTGSNGLYYSPPSVNESGESYANSNMYNTRSGKPDKNSVGFILLAFVLPVFGFTYYGCVKNDRPKRARTILIFAIAGLVISFLTEAFASSQYLYI